MPRLIPHLPTALLALLLGGLFSVALAEEATISCSKDNTLFEDNEGNVGNGRGQHLFVGKTLRGPLRRALMSFDLTHIPARATIKQVRLGFTVSQTQGGAQTLSLHRMLADWGEGASNAEDPEGQGIEAEPGDATWLHTFYPDSFWTIPGGDYVPAPSAGLSVDGGGDYLWESTSVLVADVQNWLDAPQDNFGWILLGNETVPKTAKRFFAREHATPNRRPVLHVSYETNAATAVQADSWATIKAGTARSTD
jgi:hypothetical protein